MSADPRIIARMRRLELFHAFHEDEPTLAALAELLEPRTYSAGARLSQEGGQGEELYILESGEVEISRRTLEQDSYTVAIISPEDDEPMGELGLLGDHTRQVTITARQSCEVYALNRRVFEEFGDARPEVALPIMRALGRVVCERLRRSRDDVILLFEALVDEVGAGEIG